MSFRAPKREKCHVCGKTVYEMEMMKADDKVFHKGCMKVCASAAARTFPAYASPF